MNRVIPRSKISALVRRLRRAGKKVVFTNGVFDLLHAGHVRYLAAARLFGDVLIVGLNSDASVRRLKGPSRPLQKQSDRAVILAALRSVDHIVMFGEQTPEKLISQIRPDVLVKGADYETSEIVGADFVKSYGGSVRRVRLAKGRSTSKLVRKLAR